MAFFEKGLNVIDKLLVGHNVGIVTEEIILLTGTGPDLRGTVLGKITKAPGTPVADGGNTGDGTVTVVVLTKDSVLGSYKIIFLTATTFELFSPTGEKLATAAALGVFLDLQLGFTVTAGGTPFVAGDFFTIPVDAGSGKFVISLLTPALFDGSEVPFRILAEDQKIVLAADKTTLGYRRGEFDELEIIIGAGHSIASVKAALEPGEQMFILPTVKTDPITT